MRKCGLEKCAYKILALYYIMHYNIIFIAFLPFYISNHPRTLNDLHDKTMQMLGA